MARRQSYLRPLTASQPDDSLEHMSANLAENSPARPTTNEAILQWLRGPWPVTLLFSAFFVIGLSAAQQKSPTFDEPVHLTGGYTYWAFNDYRMHPDNGNWSQRFAALPVWLGGYSFPTVNDPDWKGANQWGLSENFFFRRGNSADAMIRLGRYMQAVLAAALALIVYRWSLELFGEMGGLISLTLCVCSPIVYGFGFFVTSDMGVTLSLTAATWALWKVLHRATPQNVALAGLALSGAALTKFSGLAILPISLVLVCVRLTNPAPWTVVLRGAHEIRGRGRQLLAFAGLAALLVLFVALMIWVSFGLKYSTFGSAATDEDHLCEPWESLKLDPGIVTSAVEVARQWRLLPEGYLYGFSTVRSMSHGRHSFLNGEFNTTGFWSYFPYCLALKTPLTTFVILALAAAGFCTRRGKPAIGAELSQAARLSWYDIAPLLALSGVYLAFAMSSNLNVGHRHIMPVYPALFVLAGAAGLWFRPEPIAVVAGAFDSTAASNAALASEAESQPPGTTRAARAVVLGTLLVAIAHTLWIWPNYQAFTNTLGGGYRHGYRHLVDASTDWGQDLRALIQWLDAHPQDSKDRDRVFVSYQGTADTKYYGLQAHLLPPMFHGRVEDFPYTGGLYCISATKLQSVYTPYPGHWNKEYEALYQSLRPVAEVWFQIQNDPAARAALTQQVGAEKLGSALYNYENLRFGRLCAFLRAREPDDNIGGSILIFRLTDEDVKQLLEGPPVELLERPES